MIAWGDVSQRETDGPVDARSALTAIATGGLHSVALPNGAAGADCRGYLTFPARSAAAHVCSSLPVAQRPLRTMTYDHVTLREVRG